MTPIRLAIVDDHEIFRNGFKLLLKNQDDIELCGEAEHGKQLLEQIEHINPDVVVVDIAMPVMNGVETCRQLKTHYPHIAVIALTTFNDDHYIVDMLQAGATGYLLKNTTKAELHRAVTATYQGGMYYSKETADKLNRLRKEFGLQPGKVSPATKFSDKELLVIQLICQQLTNKEMAAQLGISVRTVESHRERIQLKIGAKNLAGIVIYALQHNLSQL